jgi:hypothetical protein
MIQLHSDCLVFEGHGEGQPAHVEKLAAEILGDVFGPGTKELVRQATAAVLHYFKHEQGRETVTLGEFIQALEHALKAFGLHWNHKGQLHLRAADMDLFHLATTVSGGCELMFFPSLHDELRRQLRKSPRLLRLRGLRDCVKHLRGTRRWTTDCEQLSDQIVEFLRRRLADEQPCKVWAMVIS